MKNTRKFVVTINFFPFDKKRSVAYGYYRTKGNKPNDGIIEIDNSQPIVRQLWTLWHELFHMVISIFFVPEMTDSQIAKEEKAADSTAAISVEETFRYLGVEDIDKK